MAENANEPWENPIDERLAELQRIHGEAEVYEAHLAVWVPQVGMEPVEELLAKLEVELARRAALRGQAAARATASDQEKLREGEHVLAEYAAEGDDSNRQAMRRFMDDL